MMLSTHLRQTLRRPLRLSRYLRTSRRTHSTSKSPQPSEPTPSAPNDRLLSTTNWSLPGPSHLWVQLQPLTYPFRAYNNIQARRPYATQLTSSVIIYFLGDLSSQTIQNGGAASAPAASDSQASAPTLAQQYDPIRALRSVLIGAISSIPSYHYFLWLGRSFNIASRPYTSLTIKVAINQLSFAPLFNTYFFGMQSLLSYPPDGPQPAAAWRRVRDTVPISWINSCKFWPAVTAFSFSFVPPQHRGVFAGCVAIGWQTYLGLLNQKAARREREASGGVAGAAQSAKA